MKEVKIKKEEAEGKEVNLNYETVITSDMDQTIVDLLGKSISIEEISELIQKECHADLIFDITEKSNQVSLINSSYAETIALFDHENILSFDVQHDFKTDEILYTVSSFSENFGLNRIGSISYEYSDITELNN